MFFPVQNKFSIERLEKRGFYCFYQVNLNEILKKCQMIFQLSTVGSTSIKIIIIKSFYPGALKSCNFVWNVNIFQSSRFIVIATSFMFYLRSRVIL